MQEYLNQEAVKKVKRKYFIRENIIGTIQGVVAAGLILWAFGLAGVL